MRAHAIMRDQHASIVFAVMDGWVEGRVEINGEVEVSGFFLSRTDYGLTMGQAWPVDPAVSLALQCTVIFIVSILPMQIIQCPCPFAPLLRLAFSLGSLA